MQSFSQAKANVQWQQLMNTPKNIMLTPRGRTGLRHNKLYKTINIDQVLWHLNGRLGGSRVCHMSGACPPPLNLCQQFWAAPAEMFLRKLPPVRVHFAESLQNISMTDRSIHRRSEAANSSRGVWHHHCAV